MLKLVNIPIRWVGGSLWFEIPKELQNAVIPYLRKKITEDVGCINSRKIYRHQFTKSSMREKYGDSIYARTSYNGLVCFYTLYGIWRIGGRDVPLVHAEQIKEEILYELQLAASALTYHSI